MDNLKLTSFRADISKAQTSILIGNKLSYPNTEPDKSGAVLYGKEGNITMSDDMLSRGTLFLGSTGSGKTNVITMLMDSVLKQLTDDDTVIIFDSKRDFLKRYFSQRNPKHIVVSSSSGDRLISRSWNLFHECFYFEQNPILTDDTYVYVNEMSKGLMRNLESPQQPFFNIAASDILRMLILSFLAYADVSGDHSSLSNKALAEFLDKAKTEDLIKAAGTRFQYIHSYLGNPNSPTPQSLGVEGFLHAMTAEIFTGPFRTPSPRGDFSIRRLVNEKGGKVVFIEYDVARGSSLSAVYSLLFDLAITEQLSSGNGRTFLFCDEMSLLPHCQHLSDALNQGRSRGLRTIASLQSINQLYDAYGEHLGKSIEAGFVNCFAFRSDADTRELISHRFGKTFETVQHGGVNIPHEGFTVTDSDIINLSRGEAFVDLYEHKPFLFKSQKFI